MRSFQSVKFRLTLWYALILTILLSFFGIYTLGKTVQAIGAAIAIRGR